jgi:hypothetical protein
VEQSLVVHFIQWWWLECWNDYGDGICGGIGGGSIDGISVGRDCCGHVEVLARTIEQHNGEDKAVLANLCGLFYLHVKVSCKWTVAGRLVL